MATSDIQDRLQPALLDRLTDEALANPTDTDAQRVMSKARLRAAVLRDLSWLFNSTQPSPEGAHQHALSAASVMNYGLPPLAGLRASKLDVHALERIIAQAIQRFEPRILPATLTVHAVENGSVLDAHNMIEFEIRGHLWAQPVPLEVLLRTRVNLEAGQVEVRDATSGTLPARVG